MAFYILILLLLSEGLGIFLLHSALPYIFALIPSFLYILHSFHHNKFHISFSLSSFFFGCSIFLYALAILYSINKEASIGSILIFLSLYLFYLYFSSYPIKQVKIIKSIYILSIIFIGAFLFFVNRRALSSLIIPQTEYQLVTPLYYPHNHLGDFLGLGIVISFFYLFTSSKLIYLIPLFIFIPFVLISFSNSAFVSIFLSCVVIIVFFFKSKKIHIRKLLFIFLIITTLMITIFIGSTKESEYVPPFKNIQQFVTKTFSFYPKTIGSTRLSYFSQAIEGVIRNPLFGIGPNTFTYFSRQFNTTGYIFSTDVHNIFLEIGFEAGIPALLFFIAFIVLKIRHGILNPTIFFFIFLYLLINFQTDYTYKIYSVLALFIFSASQINVPQRDHKNNNIGTYIFIGITLFLQIIVICILTSLIFQKSGNPSQAVLFNPFNRYAYYDLLKEAAANKNIALVDEYAKKLQIISPVNLQSELEIVNAYKTIGEPNKLLRSLEKAYSIQSLLPPLYIEQLYKLTEKYRSKEKAKQLITRYIDERQKALYFRRDKNTLFQLSQLCKKTYENACGGIK